MLIIITPMISVLIAAKDRPSQLIACLQAIAANQYTQYEVLVLDQSHTVDIRVKNYVKQHRRFQLFRLPAKGKGYALTQGLTKVKGKIIAFTDDDCLVNSNWLAIISQSFVANRCDAIFGQVLPYQSAKHKDEICPCTVQFKKKSFVQRPRYHVGIGYGNNMAFKKQTLVEIGSPKSWLGPGSIGANAEDAELILRTLLAGKTILRDPKLIVFHDRWLLPEEMRRQNIVYTQGEAACYGYFAFQGHTFARKVLLRGILSHFRTLKKNLWPRAHSRSGKQILSEIYKAGRLLTASMKGLAVGFYFYLKD